MCAPRVTDEVGIIIGLERLLRLPAYERFCSQGLLRFLLQALHGEEILCEEAILAWKGRREDGQGDEHAQGLFKDDRIKDFLEWLEEEEEETESGSEEDDDDDDDE